MRDGRALQSGTSHYMGTNFAKAFDIQYTGGDGELAYAHTTSWGMSTRMIGGVIMTHGDDKGLVLPPRLAPYQVVIVPIGRGDAAEQVLAAAQRLAGRLARAGIRAHVDTRPQLSPGFKFNDWELRGVPIRLELGPRDLAAGTAVMAVRLGEGKDPVSLDGRPARLTDELERVPGLPARRATDFRDEHTHARRRLGRLHRGGRDRLGPGAELRRAGMRGRDQGRDRRPPPAASRWRASRSPVPASAAAIRPRTASGSSSAGPTDRDEFRRLT